jgi:hypothetical protein
VGRVFVAVTPGCEVGDATGWLEEHAVTTSATARSANRLTRRR